MWPHLVIYIKITRFIHLKAILSPIDNKNILTDRSHEATGRVSTGSEAASLALHRTHTQNIHTHAEHTQPWAASRWTAKLLASYAYTHFLLG